MITAISRKLRSVYILEIYFFKETSADIKIVFSVQLLDSFCFQTLFIKGPLIDCPENIIGYAEFWA